MIGKGVDPDRLGLLTLILVFFSISSCFLSYVKRENKQPNKQKNPTFFCWKGKMAKQGIVRETCKAKSGTKCCFSNQVPIQDWEKRETSEAQ